MDSINNILKNLSRSRLNEAYEDLSQEDLIDLAKKGDSRAFEKLVSDNKDLIDMFSNKFFLKSGDKEDVKQLVTIGFWDAVSKYDPESNGEFRAFAGMIIKRKLTDEIRKENTDSRILNIDHSNLEDTVASDGEGGEATLGDTLPAKGLTPEEEFLGREGAKSLLRFMRDNLSTQEMRAIKLYIKGMKVSKISEVTGMKYKSVENAIRRVKEKITDYVKAERQTESKKLEESEDVFSEEEKAVLSSIINKIELQESVRESFGVKKRTDEAESIDIDGLLNSAEEDAKFYDVDSKTYDVRDDDSERVLQHMNNLYDRLMKLDTLGATDEQWTRAQDIADIITIVVGRLEDLPTPEEVEDADAEMRDPYTYNGVRKSDFY